MKTPRLETDRLILEPLEPRHAVLLYSNLMDSRIYAFIPQEPPESMEALERNYRNRGCGGSPDGAETWLNWVLRLRDGSGCIGRLEATIFRSTGTAGIAYLVCPAYQRKGYAREACKRILDHLVAEMSLTRIAADIDTRNIASIRLVESLGFARISTTRNADSFKGKSSDEYRYELIVEASCSASKVAFKSPGPVSS